MVDCAGCLTKIKQNEMSMECSGVCKKTFHAKCIDMKASHCKLIEEIYGIKWFCDCCVTFVDFINKFHFELNNFKQEIKNEIIVLHEAVKNKNIPQDGDISEKSYAGVTKEVVVIKPKAKQESATTKEFIKENLNPSELKVGISEIRNIQEGGVIIKCNTKQEAEKIKTAATQKLSKNYNIDTPKLKNPAVKILDIDLEMSNEELIQNMKNQNEYLNEENVFLKVITMKKMKKNYMAIIECDPRSYFKIIHEGKIYMNWSRCRVFEYINVFRCYRCGGFNHGAKQCNETVDRCLKCAKSGHKKEDCTSESIKCINCADVNSKQNTNLDINHSCFDSCCSILQKKIEISKQKICYNPLKQ